MVGLFTIRYEQDTSFTVQRQVATPWHEYVFLPDVVMVPADENVALIDLGGHEHIQVARGSRVSDDDGDRQATIFFPSDTVAELVLPDGSTQALGAVHVRATEFTIGPTVPPPCPASYRPAAATRTPSN